MKKIFLGIVILLLLALFANAQGVYQIIGTQIKHKTGVNYTTFNFGTTDYEINTTKSNFSFNNGVNTMDKYYIDDVPILDYVLDSSNIYIGDGAGFASPYGKNVFVGASSGSGSSLKNTVSVGVNSGVVAIGDKNVFSGVFCGYNSNSSYLSFYGFDAGAGNTKNYSSFFGSYSGYQNAGKNSFGIGYKSAYNNTIDSVGLFMEGDTSTAPLVILNRLHGNRVRVNGDLYVKNEIVSGTITHAFFSTEDTTYTPAVTQNIYTKLGLPGTKHIENFTKAGDSLIVTRAGSYYMSLEYTVQGAMNEDYRMALYVNGVKVKSSTISTTGAGNFIAAMVVWHQDMVAGDRLSIRITNLTNNNDPTLRSGSFYIIREK